MKKPNKPALHCRQRDGRGMGRRKRKATARSQSATKRKLAEQALWESEERLRLATTNSNTGLWDWDLRTGHVHYSSIWKSQIGYEEHEISDTFGEWRSRVHPDDLEQAVATINAFLAKPGARYEQEFRLRHKDGSYRWILAKGSLLMDGEGRPYRMLGAHIDITARKQAEQELQASQEQLRSLAAHAADAEERERQKLAIELHDLVGQKLTALSLTLNTLATLIPEGSPGEARSHIGGALTLVEQTTDCIRQVMAELRPPVLDDYGLAAALRWYGAAFAKQTGLTVEVSAEDSLPRPGINVENALFRIAQEALTNVAKHARAANVALQLRLDGRALHLTVADDGIGLQASRAYRRVAAPALGLIAMHERALSIGGSVSFEPRKPRGTAVNVEVPL